MFLKYLVAKLFDNRGQVDVLDSVKSKESGAKDTSSQSIQADKLEGLISDVDLSDVPVERRAEVKKYLLEKVKLYDAGFRAKTEEFSKEKKELESQKQTLRDLTVLKDEIEGNPALKTRITKVINDFRAGNFDADDSKTKVSMKTLDRLIDEAGDSETREGLRRMRQIVQEETSTFTDLKDKYSKLEEKFQQLEQATVSGQAERVEAKIAGLEERFGKEVIGKYKSDIRAASLKFPGQDVVKLFYHYAKEDDIKSALLHESEQEKQREHKRKEQGSSAGGFDVKTPIEISKDKHGRTNIKDLVGKIRNKYR